MSKKSLSFKGQVLNTVQNIPRGKVMSYGLVAKRAGFSGAARAVGGLMAKNQNKKVPCHRVVRADGLIGEYNGLQGKDKAQLLQKEGVLIDNNKVCRECMMK